MGEVVSLAGRLSPAAARAAGLRRGATEVGRHLVTGTTPVGEAAGWAREVAVAAVLLARAERDPVLSLSIVLGQAEVGLPVFEAFEALRERGVDVGADDAEARVARALATG